MTQLQPISMTTDSKRYVNHEYLFVYCFFLFFLAGLQFNSVMNANTLLTWNTSLLLLLLKQLFYALCAEYFFQISIKQREKKSTLFHCHIHFNLSYHDKVVKCQNGIQICGRKCIRKCCTNVNVNLGIIVSNSKLI